MYGPAVRCKSLRRVGGGRFLHQCIRLSIGVYFLLAIMLPTPKGPLSSLVRLRIAVWTGDTHAERTSCLQQKVGRF